jgi:hypothetical protein
MSLSECIFRLDVNAGSDLTHSFERKGQRITLRRGGQHRQYSSLTPLPTVSLVSFKLIHTKEHNICVGVVQQERIKKLSTRREERAISYKLCGNSLWEDGISLKNSSKLVKIEVGEVLSLFINGVRKTMQWWNSGKLLL